MKGQLTYEYYASIIVFVIFVIYITFRVMIITPTYTQEIKSQRLRSEAYQLSELLINDPGEPIEWNSLNVERIGLSDEMQNKTNLLSVEKIENLSSICSSDGYQSLSSKLGVDADDYQFAFNLTDIKTGELLVDCHPTQIIPTRQKIRMTRIAAINSTNYVNLTLEVW